MKRVMRGIKFGQQGNSNNNFAQTTNYKVFLENATITQP